MGVRFQHWCLLQRSFSKHDFNQSSGDEDNDETEEMIQFWINNLNTLWDIRFEEREPRKEDKVVQINLKSETNPNPIFISESLSPSEKKT